MYPVLLNAHSYLRYIVLLLLVIVVVKSLFGLISKSPFTKADDKLSLGLLIATHTQLLLGLGLYLTSDLVQFGSGTMKNPALRYWTLEHSVSMVIAIALITVARISHKKLVTDIAKHKRLFWLNAIALIIIVGSIVASGRGLLTVR